MRNLHPGMNSTPPPEGSRDRIARICFATAGGVSLLVLLTWLAGYWRITPLDNEENIPMAPGAAVLMLGLVSAILVRQGWPDSVVTKWLSRVMGAGVLVMSFLIFGKVIFDFQFPVEEWLTRTTNANGQLIPQGHISPLTAAAILLTSLVLLFAFPMRFARRSLRQVVALGGLAMWLVGLLVFLSDVMQVQLCYSGTVTNLMATQTAEVVGLVGLGLLLIAGNDIWPLIFFSNSSLEGPSSGLRLFWGLLALVLLFTSLIGTMGWFYFKQQEGEARLAAQKELQSIGNFKIKQISEWMDERRADAEQVFNSKQLPNLFLADPQNAALRKDLNQWMSAYQLAFSYDMVALFDSNGIVRLVTPANATRKNICSVDRIRAALRSRKVMITDLHRDQSNQPIHLNILIPIGVKPQANQLAEGVLLFDIDPFRFLYPLVQSWPTASRTAETVLFRREGNDALYLNELRYQSQAALRFRVPLSSFNTPSVQAVLGKNGVFEGVDYRGVPVLAMTDRIPRTPWFMEAKVDLDEVYAPLRQQAKMTGLFFTVLMLVSLLVVGLLRHQQQLLFARRELVQRQQADLALRETAEKLNGLFYLSPLGIALCDMQGHYLEFNQAFQDICGYSAEELKHLDYWKLTPREYEPQEALQLAAMQETGRYGPYEKEYLRKDGRRIPLCFNGMLITGRDGQTYIWSLVEDITQRRQAEVALAQERNLLNSLVINIPDYIVFKDRASRFIKINTALAKAFGLRDPAEAVGRSDADYFDAASAREFYDDEQRIMASGEPLVDKEENKIWKATGRETWTSTTKVPLRDADGKIIGLIGVARDITAHKLLEAEFRQVQKMQAIGQLAAGVAHDFNNLLTVIMGNTSMLQDGHLDAKKQAEALAQISKSADRAADLTRQLLTFSRRQPMQLEHLDLNEVIINVSKLVRSLIGEHIVLQTQFGNGSAPVHADEGMMEQILMNLVVNARDAMSAKGGRIVIQTERVCFDAHTAGARPGARAGDFIHVSVGDNGCGIPPENFHRIFEPFFTTKEVGKGTGLGLATVFGIAQQHQGWVEVESQVRVGTTFHVYLPRIESSAKGSVASPAKTSGPGGTETILLVEDELSLRKIAQVILEQQGYRVLEAESGAEALKIWMESNRDIRLLITDVVMPGSINGRDLARQLQAEKPELQVIYISGYDTEMHGEGLPLKQYPNFLKKPLVIPVLLNKVRACLDNRA